MELLAAAQAADAAGGLLEGRDRIRRELKDGKLESREVELEVADDRTPQISVMTPQGVEEMGIDLPGMMPGLFGGPKKRRVKLPVSEARPLLVDREADALTDEATVPQEAIRRAEESGIVFLDEIDKIAGREGKGGGPDVSREGVQRDLLPLVEGTSVKTKHGMLKTDHVLFIAAGAFHVSRPSDLIPELQGRFPIRVSLDALSEADFVRILTEPEHSLPKQAAQLLAADGVEVVFPEDGLAEIAAAAAEVNGNLENIGARRLHTILETVLEEISFAGPDAAGARIVIDRTYVRARAGGAGAEPRPVPFRAVRKAPLALALTLVTAGCGRKLDPMPPVLVVPARVEPLRLYQDGGDVVLRFAYPARTAQGTALTGLTKVTVYREVRSALEGARVPEPPAGDARAREEKDFLLRAEVIAELGPEALDERTLGAEVIFRDSLVSMYREKRLGKVLLRYGVTATRDRKRVSEMSPLVSILPAVPPGRPSDLVASVLESRVCLEWRPPAVMLDGTTPVVVGAYAVYRKGEADEWYEDPIGVVGKETSFADETARSDHRYLYTVRAAPKKELPPVLGPAADEAFADTRDVFPPAAPTGLLVLVEAEGTRLAWTPVLAPDLASYRAYRKGANDAAWTPDRRGAEGAGLLRSRAAEGRAVRRDRRRSAGEREPGRGGGAVSRDGPGPFPSRFAKMSGAGNDFVVFLERAPAGPEAGEAIRRVCDRRTGIGADGALFVTAERHGDRPTRVVADYFNADGGAARFCANGTRCAARIASLRLDAGREFVVVTGWGAVGARIAGSGRVTIALPEPVRLGRALPTLGLGGIAAEAVEVEVGVPHLVVAIPDAASLADLDLPSLGPPLRRHPEMPDGANVNFVARTGASALAIRTWERGVENETLACGSGTVASAAVAALRDEAAGPIGVKTRSGETLVVDFDRAEGGLTGLRLTGDARLLYEGEIRWEEWS